MYTKKIQTSFCSLHRVFDVDFAYNEKEKTINEMIKRLENWYKSLGLPTRLHEVNIDNSNFEEMAEKCLVGRGLTGNFKKLDKKDICNIYELAL